MKFLTRSLYAAPRRPKSNRISRGVKARTDNSKPGGDGRDVLELGEVELDVYQWDRASEITVCRQLRRWRLLLLGLAREIESAVAAMPSLIFDAPRPERDRAMAGEEGKLAPRSLMSQEDPAPTMVSRTTSRARVTVGSYSRLARSRCRRDLPNRAWPWPQSRWIGRSQKSPRRQRRFAVRASSMRAYGKRYPAVAAPVESVS